MNLLKFMCCLSLLFLYSSCSKTEEIKNTVSINVIGPVSGSTVSDPSDTDIHIEITATVELHDTEITLTDAAGTAIAPFNPMDLHAHTQSVTIDEHVDLSSYPAGSQFTLTIEACKDHDCAEKETKVSTFSI